MIIPTYKFYTIGFVINIQYYYLLSTLSVITKSVFVYMTLNIEDTRKNMCTYCAHEYKMP